MLHRITLDMAFPTIAHAQAIIAVAQAQWPFAVPINPGQPDQEPAFIRLQDCFHDETPPQPCITTFYIQKPPVP